MDTRKAGVYLIRNLHTGAVYIGSTSRTIAGRWVNHCGDLSGQRHCNPRLQNAWNKYGPDGFAWEVIEHAEGREAVLACEQRWIDHYWGGRMGVDCYNMLPTAGSTAGHIMSPEARAKMSAAKRLMSPETRAKMSVAKRGRLVSAETRAKMSRYTASPETRAKISAALRRPEIRAKINAALCSPEARAKTRGNTRVWHGFIAPDGAVYRNVLNLNAFSQRFGLSSTSLSMVHRGAQSHHRGWRKLPEDAVVEVYRQKPLDL